MAAGDTTTSYPELSADNEESAPMQIESLCPNCEENGMTTLLMTKIPFYKEVILMSFKCEHCGCRNNELQSGGVVQEHGLTLSLNVVSKKDLNRQVVKSEFAAVSIPQIELEIPHGSQVGEISTVEGIIRRISDSIRHGQEQRLAEWPADGEKLENFLRKLDGLLELAEPFTLVVDDPSGNSFVESADPTHVDAQISSVRYPRTLGQNKMLGLVADDVVETSTPPPEEVMAFHVDCPNCAAPAQTNMKLVDVPHFKQVVIMATNCDACGHRTAEVKSGSGVSARGCRLELRLADVADLSRDVLKSETCCVLVPELQLEAGAATLSGRFTTVEGVLCAMRDQLRSDACLLLGDSADSGRRERVEGFLERLGDAIELKTPVRFVLDDPAGNSYMQRLGDDDDRLTADFYERSFEQNEELGLNDMRTENYEET